MMPYKNFLITLFFLISCSNEVSDSQQNLSELMQPNQNYFISQYDTLTSSINSACGHSILGNTRYEKIVNFLTYMDMIFPSNNHEYTVIQGLGHTTNTFSSEIFKEYLMSIF